MVRAISTLRFVKGLGAAFVALTLVFTVRAHAQSAPDVLKAFRKLEADTEAGVTNSEYARALAEVNAELKSFADRNPGNHSAGIEALRSAFTLYLKAKDSFDEQKSQAMRYDNGEMSLRDYYDWKRANIEEISGLWKQAGQEIDRAAALLNRKQVPKEKKTP